jgi:hypothetical protein
MRIRITTVLLQLFVFSHQAPSVRCGVSNVLEGEIYDMTTPTENCDDKFVCELDCSIFRGLKTCKYNTFLDLTELLKKDNNNKIAYNKACKSGMVNLAYLDNPISLKFRHLVGLITHISQESFYHKYMKNKISFKTYPALYKTSGKKIKKLPIYHNKKFIKSLVLFEHNYVISAIRKQSRNHRNVIWGLYDFVKGLMGSKKLCHKHFEEMKDKSEGAVASMIVNEIHKQMLEALKEAQTSRGEVCDSFCTVFLRYFKFQNNPKWSEYFKTMKDVLLDLYAHDMAKKMIKKKNSEVSYCGCQKIFALNKFIKNGDSISRYFDEGYNLNEFTRFVFQKVCKPNCVKEEEEED